MNSKGMKIASALALGMSLCLAHAEHVVVTMHQIVENGEGMAKGIVEFQDTPYGLLITPHLNGLNPGMHGFHIHQNYSCATPGDHYDPKQTNQHAGPYNASGHLGDLPALYFNANRAAGIDILAPRLKVRDIIGHTLIIHAGSDNYSDDPKNGGGGARVACGLIEKEKVSTSSD